MGKREQTAQDYSKLNTLVSKAMQGDMDAFGDVCEHMGQSIVYMCYKVMGNMPDGEDAAQEVFIKTQKSIHALKNPESFIVWQYKLLLSVCNDMLRKKKRDKDVVLIEDYNSNIHETYTEYLPDKQFEHSETKEELLCLIDDLPVNMRTCILLYYYERMDSVQIAEVTGMSPAAVRKQLQRARERIRLGIGEKDTSKKNYSFVPMSMSVLTKLMHQEADTIVTPKVISGCLKAVHANINGGENTLVYQTENAKHDIQPKKLLYVLVVTIVGGTFFMLYNILLMTYMPRSNLQPPQEDFKSESIVLFMGNIPTKSKQKTGTALPESAVIQEAPVQTSIDISLKEGDCLCGHVNPKLVEIAVHGGAENDVKWRVFKDGSSKPVLKGRGLIIHSEDMLKLPEGRYTLLAEIECADTVITRAREIRVVSGEIDINEYE